MIKFIKNIIILFFSFVLIIATGGISIHKCYCKCRHISEFSLFNSKDCCEHSKHIGGYKDTHKSSGKEHKCAGEYCNHENKIYKTDIPVFTEDTKGNKYYNSSDFRTTDIYNTNISTQKHILPLKDIPPILSGKKLIIFLKQLKVYTLL